MTAPSGKRYLRGLAASSERPQPEMSRRLTGGVVHLQPVVGLIVRRSHQFAYVYAAGIGARHLQARLDGVVGQAGRGREGGGVFAVDAERRIRLVALQRGQRQAADGVALRVGEQQRFPGGIELEGGVQLPRRARRPARGVDKQVSACGDGRALREDPLAGVAFIVREAIAGQVDLLRRGVVYLHIVVAGSVRVRGVGAVGAEASVRTSGLSLSSASRERCISRVLARPGVYSPLDLPNACGLVAAVDLVGSKGGHVHRVRERAVLIVEGERCAVRVDAEKGRAARRRRRFAPRRRSR